MENNPTIPLRLPHSPQLLRCKSRSTNINSSDSSTKSLRTSSNSKRRENGQDTSVKSSNRTVHKKTEQDVSTGFVMFLPRSKSARTDVPRRNRSASTSPSAWALSPGRSSLLPGLVPRSPSWETLKPDLKRGRGGGGGGVSAVLKFFRPKKVFLVLEEEYHRFRVVHNRLLQWRFANARAEASMTAIKRVAQVLVTLTAL